MFARLIWGYRRRRAMRRLSRRVLIREVEEMIG